MPICALIAIYRRELREAAAAFHAWLAIFIPAVRQPTTATTLQGGNAKSAHRTTRVIYTMHTTPQRSSRSMSRNGAAEVRRNLADRAWSLGFRGNCSTLPRVILLIQVRGRFNITKRGGISNSYRQLVYHAFHGEFTPTSISVTHCRQFIRGYTTVYGRR